ncbi:SGNH/GDSL hydrolase family protein [Mesobacillus subterraneus]|uniref:SGNH/GDSL hydrolase family protein n=1 Tax=Mesobacillus subterraneus TaxID=285983 RepID=A0A3R9E520_9BACI|nr:SGNH/GDSL hydrolase family protein [Mesobacillus subterraneus]RSD26270.1 SGNH/GDSL hydrolase family protein [Mesobacillus subterraneus]
MKSNFRKFLALFFITAALLFLFAMQSEHYQSEDLNVYEKIEEGSSINYLVIGDSIGRGAGAERKELRWYSQFEVLLKSYSGSRAYRNLVVQSGATAFEGIYKLQKTSQKKDIDVIFLFFGENDRKYMDPETFAFFYEKLLRDAKEFHPEAEIITIIESSLKQEPYAHAIKNVSSHYGAKHLDMRIPFKESGLLTEHLTTDMVHPNGKGYQLYANSILELMKENMKSGADIASFPDPIAMDNSFYLSEKKEIASNGGFNYEKGLYVSRNPGEVLEYVFEGPILGVTAIRSVEGGKVKVYIDGEYIRTLSTWWPFTRERYLYIASGLDPGRHTVRFETIGHPASAVAGVNETIIIKSIIIAKEKED